MTNAIRDENHVTSALGTSSTDGVTTLPFLIDPVTGRLLTDNSGGSGTVTSVSVVSANGFSGTVATETTTPAITLSTTITGILKGNGTSISAVTIGSGLTYDGTTLSVTGSGTGDVVGPASSTEHAVARYDGITGKLLQNSGVVISDSNEITGVVDLTISKGLRVGFVGVPTEDAIEVGDANFGLDFGAGSIPFLEFDSSDAISYARSSNTFNFLVAADPIFVISTTAITSGTDNTLSLGTASVKWSDLFLATGAVVNFDNGNWLATHSSGILTVGTGDLRVTTAGSDSTSVVTVGGTQTLTSKTLTSPVLNTPTVGTSILPTSNDGAALGSATVSFSDLFLASGALINVANGNWVATHSSGILTVSTGDLRVTTAGTNTASVVTVGGTQTLTAKTFTSPAITTGTYSGAQLLAEGGSVALDPVLSADGTWSGITMTGTAGYTQAFGDLVYLDPTDSRWELADANSAAGADGDARGMLAMVVVAGTDGNSCTLLLQGNIRADAKFATFTINNPLYVSETAGAITQTQPVTTDVVIRVIGTALTADSIYFSPDSFYITHT